MKLTVEKDKHFDLWYLRRDWDSGPLPDDNNDYFFDGKLVDARPQYFSTRDAAVEAGVGAGYEVVK